MKLTVILPAAGSGSRLNLPFSKEIMRIDERMSLIDHAFSLFSECPQVKFVVIINENKLDIIQYLSKYKTKHNIAFVFQNPNLSEYTGAIISAQNWLGENNIVLLPDSVITLFPNTNLMTALETGFTKSDFMFLYKSELNPTVLKTKGALHIHNNRVTRYQDKPEHESNFNAYWCGFAFKREVFDKFIWFMHDSTLGTNTNSITDTCMNNTEAIPVQDYHDLGTWDEINKYRRNYASLEK
jgi:dTDP-glucose pyrophosphorylase